MDLSPILGFLPNSMQGIAALLIIACAALSTVIKPPAAGSRWVLPYRIMNIIGLNVGWATNHIPGSSSTNPRDSPPR